MIYDIYTLILIKGNKSKDSKIWQQITQWLSQQMLSQFSSSSYIFKYVSDIDIATVSPTMYIKMTKKPWNISVSAMQNDSESVAIVEHWRSHNF